MNGTNLFKIALRALANNKLRAFLTMLGIIIGVASVIAMLAIGQGSKKSIQQQISEMGSNMIMIHPGAEMRGGVRQDPSAMQTLKLENYEKLKRRVYLSLRHQSQRFFFGATCCGSQQLPVFGEWCKYGLSYHTPAHRGTGGDVYRE